jgi:hypothetical protein
MDEERSCEVAMKRRERRRRIKTKKGETNFVLP